MKLTQSLQYGGNVCVLLNYLISLTLIILANTLTIITILGVKIKFVDLTKLGINVDSFMTKSIIMCSLSLALIIFNFLLIWVIPKKIHAFIGLLLVVAFVISIIINTVELLNLDIPETEETKTFKNGLVYTSYVTFALGGLGSLLLVFSNLSKLYIKK
jgi:hypothetical protein